MRFILLIAIAIMCGMTICAYRRGWIIIAYPSYTHVTTMHHQQTKEIMVYWYQGHDWHQEKISMIWTNDSALNIYHIVNRWLEIMDDEQITETRIMLQSAIITPSTSSVYLSFDSSPLPPQASAYAKLCIIEALCKTIRENNIPVQGVYLLVHHRPLADEHIDCTNAWPINGFIA